MHHWHFHNLPPPSPSASIPVGAYKFGNSVFRSRAQIQQHLNSRCIPRRFIEFINYEIHNDIKLSNRWVECIRICCSHMIKLLSVDNLIYYHGVHFVCWANFIICEQGLRVTTILCRNYAYYNGDPYFCIGKWFFEDFVQVYTFFCVITRVQWSLSQLPRGLHLPKIQNGHQWSKLVKIKVINWHLLEHLELCGEIFLWDLLY